MKAAEEHCEEVWSEICSMEEMIRDAEEICELLYLRDN